MVVPPTSAAQERLELRQVLRRERQAVVLQNKDALVPMPAFTLLLGRFNVLGLYLAMGSELDPWPFATAAKRTALPKLVDSNTMMQFVLWSDGDPLITSPWNGDQPTDSAPAVIPDAILVPLLGFDADFNRIGQGGGHYDRYLAAHPSARRIGIAWEGQRVNHIQTEPWDVPMDAIMTEKDFYVKDLNR